MVNDKTVEYYSQIGQDIIVLKYLKNKKNGTFVDIGCGYPKYINNTYVLEKEYDWRGLSIDMSMYSESDGSTWNDCRSTKLILTDALSIDYSSLFKENDLPTTIDYLSMDLEPPSLTMECLFKIPFEVYKFNLITFEVDFGREGYQERVNVSREFFKTRDYVYIGSICSGQDDIYLHESVSYLKDLISLKETAGIWG